MSTLLSLRQRLRRAARENRAALATLALAALALGLLGTTQALAAPRVHATSVPAPDAWEEDATFTYRVPVANGSGPYPAGSELGMGEPGYFTTLSPSFLVDFRWEPRGHDPARLAASATLRLVASQDGAAPWRREVLLDQATLARAATNGTLELHGLVPLDALAREAEAEGHDPSKAAWSLVAHVAHAEGSHDFALPIRFDPPLYVLPDAEHAHALRAHGEPQTRIETSAAGLAGLADAPAAPLAALLGAAALVGLVRLDNGGDPA